MDKKKKMLVQVNQILPDKILIVPIRHRPVFPGMISPILITNKKLAKSVEAVLNINNFLGLLLQKDDTLSWDSIENLYSIGTTVNILKKVKLPDNNLQIMVNAVGRFKLKEYIHQKPYLYAKVENYLEETVQKDKELKALLHAVISTAKEVFSKSSVFTEEMKLTLINVEDPSKIADFICNIINLEKEEIQNMLETFDVKERLNKTLHFLVRELETLKLQEKIQGRIATKFEGQQKEQLLREQLKAIRDELGIDGKSKEKGPEYYKAKIEKLPLPEEAKNKCLEEVEKLDYVENRSNEYGVIRNYLDTIIDLPWKVPEFTKLDISEAQKILDKNHFGLQSIKERIIENLAVRNLLKKEKGSIICLVGPPGVGKTSLGKAIAKAMKKKFFRFSLGGMRDEAEIKGHRRTYVGAMPGKIIQALKVVKSKDALFLLDEVDKMGISFQGDPASALLEVFDPEQNKEFRDHFLDVSFDLSYITFITTGNTVETIPAALLDRMEVINLSGYILEEKVKIAQKFLIPRIRKNTGLGTKSAYTVPTNTIRVLINQYSREAGIRSLEKNLYTIYRKAASAYVQKKKFPAKISPSDLNSILGLPKFRDNIFSDIKHLGCALGLAYTTMGGSVLKIEARKIPGKGILKITGNLGKIMQESSEIAFTYVKSLFPDKNFWMIHNFHIHVPDGATPKDGPSAGITIATALISLYKNKKVKNGYAMTGEIQLTGEISAIGGLKEKLIAAKRFGIKKIIFPHSNLSDWEEIPQEIKTGISTFPVRDYKESEEMLF